MKWCSVFIIFILLPVMAVAASEGTSTAKYKLRGPYWSAGVGVVIWQEAVKLNRGSSLANMQSQFKGITFHGDYNQTVSGSYWQYLYGFEFAYGTLKGQGDQPNILDRLDNQSWMMASFNPGLIYRTSPVSRFGIIAPVKYRKIQWNFNPGSGLGAEDKAFSAGVGMLFAVRTSKSNAINLTFVHQHFWETSLWAAAWNHDF